MASSSSEDEETPKTQEQLPPTASKKVTFRSKSECESESEKGGGGGDDKISASLSSSLLFCEEDELILLTELKNVKEKNNGEIKNDWVSFHQEVQHKLSKNFTRTQIAEKVRRLKKKFIKERNRSTSNKKKKKKQKEGGEEEEADESLAHKARLYGLSISLWGDEEDHLPAARKRKRAASEDNNGGGGGGGGGGEGKHVRVPKGQPLNPSDYPSLKAFSSRASLPRGTPQAVRTAWTLIGSEAARKLENRCSKLLERENELYLEDLNHKKDVSLLILDLISSM